MARRVRATVLIVEDEALVALDMSRSLEELGYEVLGIASSASEAIAAVANQSPELVLMDIRIKGEIDGIETARLLRRNFGGPIIYMSAHTDDETLARAAETKPHAYLVKPVKLDDLHSAINSAFPKKVEAL